MPGAYLTAADIKEYLDITGGADDALLAKIATRASRWIDNFCQVPLGFDQETATSENLRGIIDREGNLLFAVGKAVANNITGLKWGLQPGHLVDLDPALCWAQWGREFVVRWMGSSLGPYRGKPILVQVTYDGGFAEVPDELVHSGIIVAARAYKSRQAGFADVIGSAETGTYQFSKLAPSAVLTTLGNYKRRAPW
jgi:hypothetical protein